MTVMVLPAAWADGAARGSAIGQATSPATGPATGPALRSALGDRGRLVQALRAAGELDPARALVHLSHVCDVQLDGRRLPVLDVRELVRGASTPRGVNRIVLLSPALRPLQRIEYGSQRPLLCIGPRLYLFGSLSPGLGQPEGNVLLFSAGGRQVGTEQVDVNDWPIDPGR